MGSDKIRVLLLGTLLVLGYFLILAWDQDSGDSTTQEASGQGSQLSDPNSYPSLDAVESTQGDVPEITNQPTHTTSIESGQSDVPEIINQSAHTISEKAKTSLPGYLIRVETDTYRAQINLNGGDLVGVELKQYPVTLEHPDIPVSILQTTNQGVYIAQSGLRSSAGPDRPSSRPLYQSTQTQWRLEDGQDVLEVVMTWQNNEGLLVRKIYQFERGSHQIKLYFEVDNNSPHPWVGNLFAQIKRNQSLAISGSGNAFAPRAYVGAAFTTNEERYLKLDFDDLEEEEFRTQIKGGWVAMLQHYFLAAWVPDPDQQNILYGRNQKNDTYQVGFLGPSFEVPPNRSETRSATLYVGPKVQSILAELADNIELTVDYGFLWWLSQPLFQVMQFFYQLVGNWGAAIIMLTFLVKLVLYPLSAMAYRSMANMRKVAPELRRLQERYADDRARLSQEMMGLYRKKKINPLGGCLPMLLQMPVFLALYWVLYESVELRQAPFMLWIEDLATRDPWFILPILMGLTMFIQQMLNPTVPDPMQARIMKMMPIIFTFFFLFFPSGLVLYWLINNILSISQQYLVNRRYGA